MPEAVSRPLQNSSGDIWILFIRWPCEWYGTLIWQRMYRKKFSSLWGTIPEHWPDRLSCQIGFNGPLTTLLPTSFEQKCAAAFENRRL